MDGQSKTDLYRRRLLKNLGITIAGAGIAGASIKLGSQTGAGRSVNNLLRMGHCAPSVLETLLEKARIKDDLLVKAAGGLAGGIGNMGAECGGLTAAAMFYGLHYSQEDEGREVPKSIIYVQDYTRRFTAYNSACNCADIRARGGMGPCVQAIISAPRLAENVPSEPPPPEAESSQACALALKHFNGCGFHCAHSVLSRLNGLVQVNTSMLQATWPFIGGTAFQGMTCGAFTAGVMALGAAVGGIENSYLRVLNMMQKMMRNQDASDNSINEFNRSINAGSQLGKWFKNEFGHLDCHSLCGCCFSDNRQVQAFIADGQIKKCRQIADGVVQKTSCIILEYYAGERQ